MVEGAGECSGNDQRIKWLRAENGRRIIMFFSDAKNQMEEKLEQERKEYQKVFQETLSHCEVLCEVRKGAVATLHSCEEYIQAISNRPYEYDLKSKKINQDYQKFEKQLKKYKIQITSE